MLRLINSSKSKYILVQSGKYSYCLPQENAYFCWSFMAKFGVCPWKTCWVVTDSPIMFHSFRQHNRMGLLTAPSSPQQRRAENSQTKNHKKSLWMDIWKPMDKYKWTENKRTHAHTFFCSGVASSPISLFKSYFL